MSELPMMDLDIDEPVMQPRCVHCKREHNALSVFAVSLGNAACASCGRTAPVFKTVEAYRSALRAAT